MSDVDDFVNQSRQETLNAIRTFKKPIHPDFDWWQERESPKSNSAYRHYLTNRAGETTAPPENVLRTLDKFESLLTWLEDKPIGEGMTSYEKAQIVCKLMDLADTKDVSVSLGSDSFDVTLKGDSEHPVQAVIGGGSYDGAVPIRLEKEG